MTKLVSQKHIVYGIVLILVLGSTVPLINAGDQTENIDIIKSTNQMPKDTHTVFGEQGTATWCVYCPSMGYWLTQVSGDFIYVALVADKNTHANQRCNELGLGGYPTTFFDGGYTEVVGGQSSVTQLQNAYDQCAARNVLDIELDLTAGWMGGGQIQVTADVTNNEGSSYEGHLHVYVTEITSRWDDYDGDPYEYAMLDDYAINQDVTVSAGGTETISQTWSGPSDITMSNILVMGSIFEQSTMYTTESASTNPEIPNTDPPTTPSIPSGPNSGFLGIPYTFSTSSTEPNGDTIKYGWDWNGDDDVDDWSDFHPSGSTANIDHVFYSTGNYDVQVKAKDQFGDESAFSPVRSVQITTGDAPAIPSAPIGETNGMHATSYTYTASTTDPNPGDQVYFKFDWDDGSQSPWIGPFDSGVQGSATKIWDVPGTFDVKVKAKDLADSETDWSSETTVVMGNTPPDKPRRPSGPLDGVVGEDYTFSTRGSDEEGDTLEYLFDWGDGSDSGWISTTFTSNAWTTAGTYDVRVKSRDWDQSEWSDTLRISIEAGSITVDVGGPYTGVVGEDIQFSGSATEGTEPYSWSWNFGDNSTSTQQNPTHAYTEPGEYVITLAVSDEDNGYGADSSTASIILSNPPADPVITGPSEGKTGESHAYTFSCVDPDGDDVYLMVEWFEGDENATWLGPYASGEEVTLEHIWNEDGDYSIRCKAKDTNDFESDWTTYTVTMPYSHRSMPEWLSWILENLFSMFPMLELFF